MALQREDVLAMKEPAEIKKKCAHWKGHITKLEHYLNTLEGTPLLEIEIHVDELETKCQLLEEFIMAYCMLQACIEQLVTPEVVERNRDTIDMQQAEMELAQCAIHRKMKYHRLASKMDNLIEIMDDMLKYSRFSSANAVNKINRINVQYEQTRNAVKPHRKVPELKELHDMMV